MISPLLSHLLIPYIIAMLLAIMMGGSETGPAFSAAYGANGIRKNLNPVLFEQNELFCIILKIFSNVPYQ